jgi:hypothetical protein
MKWIFFYGMFISIPFTWKYVSINPGATAGVYFELGYAFKKFSIFAGAGDGWHSTTGDFKLVNIGISSTKEIKITDTFSIPLKATAILNPATEQFMLVAGITL